MLKATATRARCGAALKHNNRTFDLDKANHIDQSRTHLNYNLYSQEESLRRYIEHYGKQFEELNERARASGHSERIKTAEEHFFSKNKKYKPQEFILQVGNCKEHIQRQLFNEITFEFIDKFQEKYPTIDIVNIHFHFDEKTDHGHFDFLMPYYNEKTQRLEIGNNTKSLEQMGIERPDLTKPQSRFNSPMMTFCEDVRKLYQDICIKHGLELDLVPSPRSKEHLTKERYIEWQETEQLKQEHEKEIQVGTKIRNSYNRLVSDMLNPEPFIEKYIEIHDEDYFDFNNKKANEIRGNPIMTEQMKRDCWRDCLRHEAQKRFEFECQEKHKQLINEAQQHLNRNTLEL